MEIAYTLTEADGLALANFGGLFGEDLQLRFVLRAVGAVVEIERAGAELIDRRVFLEELELLGRALLHVGPVSAAQRLAHLAIEVN